MSSTKILRPTTISPETWKPILWREWQRHGNLILKFVSAYIILFYIMPFDENGSLLLITSFITGQFLATRIGGADLSEGSESYAFIMPVRRADYFWAKYIAGLILFVALAGVAFILQSFGLHHHFWSIFSETGLADSKNHSSILFNNVSVLSIYSILAYTNSYSLASSARSHTTLQSSWFMGTLITIVPQFIIAYALNHFSAFLRDQDSAQSLIIFIAVSTVVTALTLFISSQNYSTKNPNSSGKSPTKGIGIIGWVFITIGALALISYIS